MKVIKIAAVTAGAFVMAKSILRKMSEYDLANKTVLITGGSRGLGLIMARQFGREGARVVICARNEQELDRARIDLKNRGTEVLALRCDICRNR